MYIHERENWTDFRWNSDEVAVLLDDVCREQGKLLGRLGEIGFDDRLKAMAENLTYDIVNSSEIEGIILNVDSVRSSIARRLGIENIRKGAPSHYIDAVVSVMLDAMEHYDMVLTKDVLCAWQAGFFPTGYSDGSAIETGQYRTHEEHIVSGYLGREKVHYIAPSPQRVETEMGKFIDWFNSDKSISPIICSAIAHFWFVTIHPFEDGNGRLARIIADMALAKGDRSRLRFYSISQGINSDKSHYYDILERCQKGDGDITEWIVWYLKTLGKAIEDANAVISSILNKSIFWMKASGIPLTDRQTHTLNLFLDGYQAKITAKNWANINKCSKDTAIRDIHDLVGKGLLIEDVPRAKRPSYSIHIKGQKDITSLFKDVRVDKNDSGYFLCAIFNSHPVRERILELDAERFFGDELPLANLLSKYCYYLLG